MTTKDHTAALREAIARHFPEDPANAVRAYAALTEVLSQPQQPAGWRLVPTRATKAMQDAWDGAPQREGCDKEFHGAYAAMIEAAPAHPSQQEDCRMCGGKGLVGGFLNAENGYDAIACPECAETSHEDPADYKRMFEAAVRDLAAISAHLGLDPDDDGGANPIIYAIDELRGSQQEDDARDADEDEPERFVVLKASGSRYAYVNDTLLGKTVKRYDVLRGDGWGDAKRHAERLNRDALNSAGEGGKNGAHE